MHGFHCVHIQQEKQNKNKEKVHEVGEERPHWLQQGGLVAGMSG
jgi:hypothetical protein